MSCSGSHLGITINKNLDTVNNYYDQNQIKDIVKGGLVTETAFNLDSPATSNNQYLILVRFYYSSNEYFDIKSLFVCSFCPSIFD
jgi:hypothetical protein